MSKKYVVGLDLGGTKIYTALVDLDGTIIKEKVVETLAFEGEETVINRMMDTIDYVIPPFSPPRSSPPSLLTL